MSRRNRQPEPVSSASALSIQPDPFDVGPAAAVASESDPWEPLERVCFVQFIRAPFQTGQADVYDERGGWEIARRGDTFRLTWKLSGQIFFSNVRAAWF